MLKISILHMNWKIIDLRLQTHFLGASELTTQGNWDISYTVDISLCLWTMHFCFSSFAALTIGCDKALVFCWNHTLLVKSHKDWNTSKETEKQMMVLIMVCSSHWLKVIEDGKIIWIHPLWIIDHFRQNVNSENAMWFLGILIAILNNVVWSARLKMSGEKKKIWRKCVQL